MKLAPEGQFRVLALEAPGGQDRYHDHAPRHLLRLQFLQEAHGRHLPLILVTMVACQHQHSGSLALGNTADMNERAGPAGRVRDLVDAQMTDLFAGGMQINAAGNGSGTHWLLHGMVNFALAPAA